MMLCENMYKVYTNMDTHRNSRVCSPLTRLRVSTSSCSFMSHLSPVFKDVDPGATLSQGASQQCHLSAVGSWASHVISPSQISSEKGWKKKSCLPHGIFVRTQWLHTWDNVSALLRKECEMALSNFLPRRLFFCFFNSVQERRWRR